MRTYIQFMKQKSEVWEFMEWPYWFRIGYIMLLRSILNVAKKQDISPQPCSVQLNALVVQAHCWRFVLLI